MAQDIFKKLELYINHLDKEPQRLSRAFLWLWSLSFFLNYAESWRQPFVTFLILCVCAASFFLKNLKLAWIFYLSVSTSVMLMKMPILANHSVYNLYVNLFFVFLLFKNKITKIDWQIARALLLSLIAVYFWAALHKTNVDYLYYHESCAYSFMNRIDNTYFNGALPSWLTKHALLPLITIVFEFLIALLLFFRRTYVLGVFASLSFHLVLAPLEFIDFTMVSLSILFLTSFYFVKNLAFIKFIRSIPIFVCIQLLLGTLSFFAEARGKGTLLYTLQSFILYIFVGYFLFITFKHVRYLNAKTLAPLIKTYLVFPVFLFFLGSFNYLGLATSGTFSMFSNIRTEGESWNHVFLPKWLKVFDYQDKIYWTIEAPKHLLRVNKEHPRLNYGMPEIEFHRAISDWEKRGLSINGFRYETGGEKFDLSPEKAKEFLEKNHYTWLEKKFLYFRRIQREFEPNTCKW